MIYLNGKANDGYHNPKTDFRSYFISFDDGARLEIMTRPELEEHKKHPFRTGYAHSLMKLDILFPVVHVQQATDIMKAVLSGLKKT